jgi:type II secretory pathway pseudopilin PulG
MSEGIVVAVIGGVSLILGTLVQTMRRENNRDHAVVAQSLNRIETKLDDHIDDHLKGDV